MAVPRLQHDETSAWLDIGLEAGSQGGALYAAGTAESTHVVTEGDLRKDATSWRIPSINGSFEHDFGVIDQPWIWRGNLRATEAALAAMFAQRRTFRQTVSTYTFLDDASVEYARCRLATFEIGERRRIVGSRSHNDTELEWIAPYRIVVVRLEF